MIGLLADAQFQPTVTLSTAVLVVTIVAGIITTGRAASKRAARVEQVYRPLTDGLQLRVAQLEESDKEKTATIARLEAQPGTNRSITVALEATTRAIDAQTKALQRHDRQADSRHKALIDDSRKQTEAVVDAIHNRDERLAKAIEGRPPSARTRSGDSPGTDKGTT